MDATRLKIIVVMGGLAYLARMLPQILLVGKNFPESLDRYLRYLSYAFICGIISNTLFLAGARFDVQAAPYRAAALMTAIFVARRTKSAVTGMISGAILVFLLSWVFRPA